MRDVIPDKPEPWSKWDLDRLALCVAKGRSVTDTADLLYRSEAEVRRKAEELRLVEKEVAL